MQFIKIKYFKFGNTLCWDDWNNTVLSVNINPNFILSYSDKRDYTTFSGESKSLHCVTMSNGDVYNMSVEDFADFIYNLSKIYGKNKEQ